MLDFNYEWRIKKKQLACDFKLNECVCVCVWVCVLVMSDSVPPWTVAHQAPLSIEFSRQEYWSGLPFPSPGDLPDPGMEPGSPELQAECLPSKSPGFPDDLGTIWFIHNWTYAQLLTDQSLVYILDHTLIQTEIFICYIKFRQLHYIYYHKFASLFFFIGAFIVYFFYLDFPSF